MATPAASRERAIFQTDWTELSAPQQQDLGMDEFRKAMALQDKIETFASPATISAAQDLLASVDLIPFASFGALESGDFAIWHPKRRKSYWEYAEAHYEFMVVARKEMGLKPLPVPPGLERHREHVKKIAKLNPAERPEEGYEGHEG